MSDIVTLKTLAESAQAALADANFNYMTEAKSVFADKDAFATLIESLCVGLSEQDADGFTTLAENTKNEFLMEANTSASLNAFAPMQMMLLRAIYPRLIARKSVESRTMQAPVEIFGWLQSFVRNAAGERILAENMNADFTRGTSLAQTIDLPAQSFDVFTGAGVARTPNVTVDRDSKLQAVTVVVTNASGAAAETKTVAVDVVPTIDGAFYAPVSTTHTSGNTVNFVVLGSFDRETGIISLVGSADNAGSSVESVNFSATTSFENNHTVLSVENEYKKETIEVGDGEIVHSTIPYSYLKDTQALWNLDAMAEAVNVMGGIFSQVTDVRIMNDLYSYVDSDADRILTWVTNVIEFNNNSNAAPAIQ